MKQYMELCACEATTAINQREIPEQRTEKCQKVKEELEGREREKKS